MVAAIRHRVTVQAGGVIEVRSPDLRPGDIAEVIVLLEPAAAEASEALASFIGSGKGSFSSIEQVDAFIRSERDAWEP